MIRRTILTVAAGSALVAAAMVGVSVWSGKGLTGALSLWGFVVAAAALLVTIVSAWPVRDRERATNPAPPIGDEPAEATCPRCAAVIRFGEGCAQCGWRPVESLHVEGTHAGDVTDVSGRLARELNAHTHKRRRRWVPWRR